MSWKGLIFVAALTVPVFATGEEVSKQEAQPEMKGEKPSGSRLRFRKGPVCMCAGGLSEKDIRKAEQARQAQNNKIQEEDSQ